MTSAQVYYMAEGVSLEYRVMLWRVCLCLYGSPVNHFIDTPHTSQSEISKCAVQQDNS